MPTYDFENYIRVMRPIPAGWPNGIHGIPFIKKTNIDLSLLGTKINLVSLSNISIKDKNAKDKIIQTFKYDTELDKLYNKVISKLAVLARYYAVSTLDSFMHTEIKRRYSIIPC